MRIQNQKGLTLVEIMIALILSSIIIAGIVQVFTANRQSYAISESLVRIQENGRFAMNFMTAALRSTGNYGCVPGQASDTNNIQIQLSADQLSELNPILVDAPGTDATLNTQDGAANAAPDFDDPDTLTILVTTGETAEITGLLTGAPPHQFSITAEGDFEEDDYVLVSNCEVGDYIQLGNQTAAGRIHDSTGGVRSDFYVLGNMTSTVQEVQAITFSIDQAEDALEIRLIDTSDANGEMDAPQQLLTGVENMQLEYGVDTGNDLVPDYFDTITNVVAQGNQDDIVAVKIRLVAVSGTADEGFTEDVTTGFQTFDFNRKQGLQVADNRLRRTFETTVSLRNQLN